MEGVAAILAGLLLGLACGGEFKRLSETRLRWEYLTLGLFVLQSVVRSQIGLTALGYRSWYLWAVLASVLACLLLAQGSGALRLVAAGVGLNVAVVLVNGGMPVGVHPPATSQVLDAVRASAGFYSVADARSMLVVLGDVLQVPWGAVGSIGDMLMLVGIVTYLVANMTRPNPSAA